MVYRGVLPPLLQRCSSGAVMFGVQSLSERTLIRSRFSEKLSPGLTKSLSAVLAGFCESPLMPFERVQTLLQNQNNFPSYRNTFHTLKSLSVEHGIWELYRGLTPILLRNSMANVLYFCGHKWLSDVRVHRADENALDRGLWNFALGGLLGGTIGFITFPLNVIKTRMQSSVGGKFETIHTVFVSLVYHPDGSINISRLFRGGPANFMRSILSWGIITMTYHFLLESCSGIKM
ncbi:Mitochondrial carrier triple repeat protein 1 [Fasciolopsis buskii]|uniref:Mitochondrial carrier triple repeat protein 1 n=1 Tax=Fasciolopsis buskii TaxID=27845 RepID=A0A8E0RSW9_9TREM|nr:Mitochondrial carrier triple repeat protein 1 [Fasciolopsis buski]